jgi:hypothetical protein
MPETRGVRARVSEALEARARSRAPELAYVDRSTLVRVGLAVLADPAVELGSVLESAMRTAMDDRQPTGRRRHEAVAAVPQVREALSS